jgi:hypothetical protein
MEGMYLCIKPLPERVVGDEGGTLAAAGGPFNWIGHIFDPHH